MILATASETNSSKSSELRPLQCLGQLIPDTTLKAVGVHRGCFFPERPVRRRGRLAFVENR